MTGSSLSSTVIVNVQDSAFPDPSVAVHVTSLAPKGNDAPLARPAVSAGVILLVTGISIIY